MGSAETRGQISDCEGQIRECEKNIIKMGEAVDELEFLYNRRMEQYNLSLEFLEARRASARSYEKFNTSVKTASTYAKGALSFYDSRSVKNKAERLQDLAENIKREKQKCLDRIDQLMLEKRNLQSRLGDLNYQLQSELRREDEARRAEARRAEAQRAAAAKPAGRRR